MYVNWFICSGEIVVFALRPSASECKSIHLHLACRVVARRQRMVRPQRSAYAKATARQSSLRL